MRKVKVYTETTDRCVDCPYYYEVLDECLKVNPARRVPGWGGELIPDWCPLEDWKENRDDID